MVLRGSGAPEQVGSAGDGPAPQACGAIPPGLSFFGTEPCYWVVLHPRRPAQEAQARDSRRETGARSMVGPSCRHAPDRSPGCCCGSSVRLPYASTQLRPVFLFSAGECWVVRPLPLDVGLSEDALVDGTVAGEALVGTQPRPGCCLPLRFLRGSRSSPVLAACAADGDVRMIVLCFVVGGFAILSAVLQTLGIIPKPPVGLRKGDLPLLVIGVLLSAWLGKSCAEARNPSPHERSSSFQSQAP